MSTEKLNIIDQNTEFSDTFPQDYVVTTEEHVVTTEEHVVTTEEPAVVVTTTTTEKLNEQQELFVTKGAIENTSSTTVHSGSNVTTLKEKEVSSSKLNDTKEELEEDSFKFHTTGQKIRVITLLAGVLIAMFMMALNSTVVAPALTIIATDLDGTQSETWIATAYLVALNVFQPLSGRFSDIFGRKSVFIFGFIVFFIGSLINALSTSINMLIAGRTIQGFGGGGVMSMTYIVITDIAPVHLRPQFQSFLAISYGVASVIGPLLGGAFVDHATWHWDFWFNVILAVLSFFMIQIFLKSPKYQVKTTFISKLKEVDWLGTLFSTGFVVCLLLALNWGYQYGWSSGHSIGPFVAAAVSLIALIYVEGWVAKYPLLPARVVFNPPCTIVYCYMMCVGFNFIGTLYFGPVYYQAVFGADSMQSGLRLIPYMIFLIVGAVGGGALIRRFPNTKYYLVVGAVSNVLGYGLFYTVDENSSWGQQAGYLVFCGLAFGLSAQNSILTVQSYVDVRDIAIATSTNQFAIMLACSVGVAIYQTLFATFLKQEFLNLPLTVLAVASEAGALTNYLYIRDLPAAVQVPVVHAYAVALRKVFILPIVAAAVSFILTLFFRNVKYGAVAAKLDEEVALEEAEGKKISL